MYLKNHFSVSISGVQSNIINTAPPTLECTQDAIIISTVKAKRSGLLLHSLRVLERRDTLGSFKQIERSWSLESRVAR